jgi:hypothetical protein
MASSVEVIEAKDGNSTTIVQKALTELDATIGSAQNVSGFVEISEDPLLTKVKRCTARGLAATGSVVAGLGCITGSLSTFVGVGSCLVAWLLHEPERELSVDVIREVIDGNLVAQEVKSSIEEEEEKEDEEDDAPFENSILYGQAMLPKEEVEEQKEPYVANIRTNDGYVTVPRKIRRANRMGGYLANRKPAKVPVLAGEICGTLKLDHMIIRDTPANRMVIQKDASRLVKARRRDGDRMFKNLRDNDLYDVALYAAKMYWVPSQSELDATDMFEDRPVLEAQADRSSWAVGPSSQ